MAAIAIPLLVAAAPLLEPVIRYVVLNMEHLFGAGTGPQKLSTAVTTMLGIANDLSKAGKIPGTLDAASVTGLIQAIVTDMKNRGVLTPELATSIITAQAAAMPPTQNMGATTTTTFKIVGGTLQVASTPAPVPAPAPPVPALSTPTT